MFCCIASVSAGSSRKPCAMLSSFCLAEMLANKNSWRDFY